MDFSSRWYKAAGATLIAAAVTARYVAKWRRRRSLRRAGQSREGGSGRCYIGLDLTDPTATKQRLCDVAVLSPDLTCTFSQWAYREDGSGIIPPAALGKAFILAIDGPQGLAGDSDAFMRKSERLVNAPGRTPYAFPTDGRPFSGFITGSVKLFYRLVTSGSRFRLLGLDGIAPGEANLIEVFPGHAFKQAAPAPLPRKQTEDGRRARFELLESLGVVFPNDMLPTADQLDAAMAAWIAYAFDRGETCAEGQAPELDERAGVIREGYIVRPDSHDDPGDDVEVIAPV